MFKLFDVCIPYVINKSLNYGQPGLCLAPCVHPTGRNQFTYYDLSLNINFHLHFHFHLHCIKRAYGEIERVYIALCFRLSLAGSQLLLRPNTTRLNWVCYCSGNNLPAFWVPETNFVHFSVVVHTENLRIRDKSVGACKLHKFRHALRAWEQRHELIWHFIDDLPSRRANEMRRTYLILRKSSKSPNHASSSGSSSGNNGQTRHIAASSQYPDIQIWLTKFHSFFLHFSISLFSAAICDSCCANVCDKSNRSWGKFAPLSRSRFRLPRNAQVSEKILATFTLALLICNLAAMSMLMARLANLLCYWCFVRAQSGDKPSDANALKRNYLCHTFQHPRMQRRGGTQHSTALSCFRMTDVVSTF